MTTFSFYAQNGGKLDELEFNRQARKAVTFINYQTFNRLINYEDTDDRLKFLVFDMIEMQYKDETDKEVSSMSTGSASVSYNVTKAEPLEKKLNTLSRPVLSNIFVNGVRSNFRG